MAGVISFIVDSGVRPEQPSHLQRRIRVVNVVGLLVGLAVGASFLVISLMHFPELWFIPLIGTVTSTFTFLFNRLGFINFTRVFNAILPTWLAVWYAAYLTGPDEPGLTGMLQIALAFSLICLLVIDPRERMFVPIIVVNSILVGGFDFYKGYFEFSDGVFDKTVALTGYLSWLSALLAVLVAFGNTLVLVSSNRSAEKRAEGLLNEAEERNELIKNSESELRESLKELELAREEEKKRQWVAEGISQINTMLRNDNNVDKTYDDVLSFMVTYIKANQGALFTVEEEDNQDEKLIQLRSLYAQSRKKYARKEVRPGEGLIGQAFLEKDFIYLTDVPKDYIRIASGLGEATPKALVIMPMLVNAEAQGFLEIASFQEMAEHEIDFLRKAAETLGSYSNMARVNQRTKLLLEQTMQQTEEMHAQEEEMRQNAEEMLATTEEMMRKEQEYLEQIQELEAELEQLREAQVEE